MDRKHRLAVEALESRQMLTASYSLVDLGDLSGGADYSEALGINDLGQVVGYSEASTGNRAFLWTSAGGMVNLGDLPGGNDNSTAYGINSSGQVVGAGATAATNARAFSWQSGSGLSDLGDVTGGTAESGATAINTAGQIVGYSNMDTGHVAVLWQSGTVLSLGLLPGGDFTQARAINNHFRVAGYGSTATGLNAFLWINTVGLTNLGDLPGGNNFSIARGINDSDQVIGTSHGWVDPESPGLAANRAFLWQSGTGMIDLGDLPGGSDASQANGINNAGQVVGNSGAAGGGHAYVWQNGVGMQDLNTMVDATGAGWTLQSANAINNVGQIVGYGITPTGATHAFLLSPMTQAPIADAGGPYSIKEGDLLSLNASASFDPEGTPLTYSWDVNGDGNFGDATGVAPTLTWAQLIPLGINNGPSTFNNLRVRVADSGGTSTTSPATSLTVQNTPPSVSISGPGSAQRGASTNFTFSATDPSPPDQAQSVTFAIDWGDGSPLQTTLSNLALNVSLSHIYATIGARTISVTATNNQDGSVSTVATMNVNVTAVQLLTNAGLTDLVWTGTGSGAQILGNDHVRFEQVDSTTIRVITTLENGVAINVTQTFSGVTGWVRANGGQGEDTIDASELFSIRAMLEGSNGNDTLYGGHAEGTLVGGYGSDVIIAGNGNNTIYGANASANGGEGTTADGDNLIVGGTGNDTIYGAFGGNGGEGATESGRNLIIGNGGSDSMIATGIDGSEGSNYYYGSARGSILVGGTTNLSQTALTTVLSEWSSSRDYATRVANISGIGSGPRNNGSHFLQAGVTVFNDNAVDQLKGNAIDQFDWYVYSIAVAADVRTNVRSGEVSTLV